MKCDQLRPLMIDYLYDEISDEDRKLLNSHLKECEKCRAELESMKSTSQILQKWEDVEPGFNLVIVTKNVSWFENIKERLKSSLPAPKKIGLGLAYGLVGIFLILAIGNTEISYQQGNFKMRIALFSKPTAPVQNQISAETTHQVLQKFRQENLYLMKTMIEQSESRLRKEWATTLTDFNQNLEQQRIRDLQLISAGLFDIERNTYKKIQRTDNSINELMRYISTPRK